MLLPTSSASICSQGMVFKLKEIIAHYNADRNNSVEQETLMRQGGAELVEQHLQVLSVETKHPCALVKGLPLAGSITSSVIVTGVKKACDHRCQ